MEIHQQLLKKKISSLNNLLENYENVYLNYYNKIKEIDKYWNNNQAKKLLFNIEEEKKQSKRMYDYLKETNIIYKYIYDRYKNIGEKIKVNFEVEEKIMTKIDNCINNTKELLIYYKTIDKSNFDNNQIVLIESQQIKIEKQLNKLYKIQKNISDKYKTIKDIENDIKNKISKTNFKIFSETDISNVIDDVR